MLPKSISPVSVLLGSLAVLSILGLLSVYSSSYFVSDNMYGTPNHYIFRQLIFFIAAVFVAAWFAQQDLESLRPYAFYTLLGSILLLILVFIPGIGVKAGGASRWINLIFFRVQPGELFKITLIFYLAHVLAKQRNREADKQRILRALFPVLGILLLLLEPDFGTSVLLILTAGIMLFVAGSKMGYLVSAGLMSLPIGYHLITSSAYRMSRVQAFLDPWAYKEGSGYQIVQSLISIGSGQTFGSGLAEGKSKLFFLPAAHTDFIFSHIAEEFGFVGVSMVILAFACIIAMGIYLSMTLMDPFKRYLALGISACLGLQTVMNIFVVLGMFPTKGITLPFVSYGGSSLLVSGMMAGILISLATKDSSNHQA